MTIQPAFALPGPFELIILSALVGIVVVVVTAVMLMLAASRRGTRQAFPVVPIVQADGPGNYRVSGVDKQTREDRNVSVQAESRANAQVKAELDGIIVTHVDKTP